jgi:hypothetical protein
MFGRRKAAYKYLGNNHRLSEKRNNMQVESCVLGKLVVRMTIKFDGTVIIDRCRSRVRWRDCLANMLVRWLKRSMNLM